MAMRLAYAIHFVADMDRAVAFYRDTLGLPLKFASPEWTEFSTGPTTLALHPASKENPAGTTHLGLHADDIAGAHKALTATGVRFTREPAPLHGITLAEFVDPEGARVSLSG
ncbi:MAG TPA: VOC family protein [Casimicrobiaceae bacterium]|nr:VOC family protein [Casimicrobiaceae bacterium]